MKYSFIIAMYNAEKYIENCLKALINQTNQDFEIIIVDDGSTDKSKEIVSKYLNNEKIKYIYQKNSGCSIARNTAIKNASGEYIVIIDADDMPSVNLLSDIEKYGNNSDVIKYRVECIEEKKNDRFELVYFDNLDSVEAMKRFCQTLNIWATPWGYAFKRKLFIDNNLYFEGNKYHEDFGLVPSLILNSDTVTSIDKTGYYYIKRPNSLTTTFNDKVELKRAQDFIFHYIVNIKLINNNKKIDSNTELLLNQYFSYRLYKKLFNSSKKTQGIFNNINIQKELAYDLYDDDKEYSKKI